jgi:ElaB/YqjD/DUF883 family membrane-anchored ribosome-binding protein
MASAFSRIRDGIDEVDLERQVENLRKEVAWLSRLLSKQGANAYSGTRDTAAEIIDEVWTRFSDALPKVGRQARLANKTVQDNPVAAAVVGIAVVGLLIGLMARRRT